MENRTKSYAQKLSRLIKCETVSEGNRGDKTKFYDFQKTLSKEFPHIFSVSTVEDFDGSFLMVWKGKNESELPIMFMNHQDVVSATGEWKHPPFAGEIQDGKVWGRGTLDTKGGLWAMLQSADELAKDGFVPNRDIYFVSTCSEETDGEGGYAIAQALKDRGVKFRYVLDEGGMIIHEPINGAKGTYAMVGVGEKGCVDLKFIARSNGGHASTPGKNTPLVRLAKFACAVEKSKIFKVKMNDTVCEMFSRIGRTTSGITGYMLRHSRFFKGILTKILPKISTTAGAMLKTTVAFTMAQGSLGANVLPSEAWLVANMRYSHHQGGKDSIKKIVTLAKKYGIQTEVMDKSVDSSITDYKMEGFALVEKAVNEIFDGVITTPYIMTGASDCRFMDCVSENCLRFTPFVITDAQLESIHGVNENVDLSSLVPAVEFYKRLMMERE